MHVTKARRAINEQSKLEEAAITAFKRHWASVLKNTEKGKSLATNRAACFEGDTAAHSRLLAKRFYGPAHARTMCRMTDEEIASALSCYLPRAIAFAMEQQDEPDERLTFIRDLVRGEYVIFDTDKEGWIENEDELWGEASVERYPAPVLYDDWYERTVGSSFFTHGAFLLIKSTGEPFEEDEVKWLPLSIQTTLDSNGPEELYGLQWDSVDACRIKVCISTLEPEQYIFDVMEQVDQLDDKKLLSFLGQVTDRLKSEVNVKLLSPKEKKASKWSMIEDAKRLTRRELLTCLENLLLEQSAEDIRQAEDLLNRISKRKLRDYHTLAW